MSSLPHLVMRPSSSSLGEEEKCSLNSLLPGVVLPVTWPCYYDGELLGIVGLDIHFGHLVEGITYFSQTKNSYAFLVDKNGQCQQQFNYHGLANGCFATEPLALSFSV